MNVIFKDGSSLAVTEIQGSRITGTDSAGQYVDRKVKEVVGFAGRVVFYTNLDAPTQYVDGGAAPRSLPTPDYFTETDAEASARNK